MLSRDPEFEIKVQECFRPLANKVGLSLRKLKVDVFEMSAHGFALRIRGGTGHSRGFLVTLARQSSLSESLGELTGEIGLGNFAEVYGENMGQHQLHTAAGYHCAFEEAAEIAEKVCVPFLLGLRNIDDFDRVREYVDEKSQKRKMSGKT